MYGNSGQKILRQNFVKGIILAHHNHVEPFLSTESTEVPTLEAYLDSLGNTLNKRQCLDAAKRQTRSLSFLLLFRQPYILVVPIGRTHFDEQDSTPWSEGL